MGIWVRTGSASVANSASIVTGNLTTWLVSVRPGDGFSADGGKTWYEILSVDNNTQLTLARNFAETSVVNGAYEIDNRSYRHQIESDILETLRATLAGQTQVIETSGPPSPSIGADKSIAFDPDARCYYHKAAGTWGDAISLGGADGVDAGFQFAFDTSITMGDPGTGKIRFNHGTFASITALAIDDLSADIGNPDVSAFIGTWAGSTSSIKGTLIIRKVGSSAFRVFAMTGLTDNSGWTQLAVTPIALAGSFSAADQLAVSFVRVGDKGNAGTDGASAGFLMTLDRATITMVDPGAGKLKFNNASFNSVTAMAIDDQSSDTGNPDVSAAILAWAASTNSTKGQITVRKVGATQNFVSFDLTGITDNAGWSQLAVAFVASGGTLMTGDVCSITFSQAGNKGIDGTNGADGASQGFAFTFDTATSMASPGAGKLRLNSGTIASVSAIAIADQSAASGNPDVSASVLAWDDSTNSSYRGTLRISKRGAEQVYAEFAITGATTDNSGWSQLAVSLVSSAGAFSNADTLVVSCARAGNKGADGLGAGDVVGPSSASDGNLVAFDTSSGKLIKDTGVSISVDGTFAANSDAIVPTQKATVTYVDARISAQLAASDVEVLKGALDCSGNPNYPAADAGHVYRVSVAGKVGGASGPSVEVGDRLECYIDSSAAGTHASVGANWIVSQVNIDGAVVGPPTSTSGNVPTFNGSGGKVLQDSGKAFSTDGALASNSDNKIPTEKAVKTYADAGLAAQVDAKTVLNTLTASGTAVLGDAGKTVEMNVATANTYTIPPNSSVAFPVGTYINVGQYGAGATTITAGVGVTIRNRAGLKLGGQYALATLYKRATDEWVAGGDLTT